MTLRTLYITYDGLTDHLGRSQVLPYLQGLSKSHEIHILSCEKRAAFKEKRKEVVAECQGYNLHWYPLSYTKRPHVLSTIWDILRLSHQAKRLHAQVNFELVHCRSYIASIVGRNLKRQLKIPFVFDMRGFWVEERVEGGIWSLRSPLYALIYRYFKAIERTFLAEADHIVSLTENASEILRKDFKVKSPISVIPCCADENLFSPSQVDPVKAESFRNELGIQKGTLVLTYLGSLGTWYLLEEMVDFFQVLKQQIPTAKFLFITSDLADIEEVRSRLGNLGRDVISIKVPRNEVATLLSLSSLGIFFIKQSYSKRASSPTKLGEMLSFGLPVIASSDLGDVNRLFGEHKIGACVKIFSVSNYQAIVNQVPELLSISPEAIRRVARQEFSLTRGVKSYQNIYASIQKNR